MMDIKVVCMKLFGDLLCCDFGDVYMWIYYLWMYVMSDYVVVVYILLIVLDKMVVCMVWFVYVDVVEGVDYDVKMLIEVWVVMI